MTQITNSGIAQSLPKVEINKENVQNTIAKSSQVVSDSFESNSAVKTISSSASDGGLSQAAPLVPLLYVVDKFIDGRMAGDVQTNVLGKAANLGDKISNAFHLERFLSEEKIAAFKNKLATNRFTKYFTDGFKANPICSMAKPNTLAQNMGSKLDDQAQKVLSAFTEIKYTPEVSSQLKGLGTLSKSTLQLLDDVGPLTERLTPDFLSSVSSVMDELSSVAPKDAKGALAIKENITKFLSGADEISELGLSEQLSSFFSKFADGKYAGKAISLSDDASRVVSSVSKKQFSTAQILDAVDDLVANGIPAGGKDLSIARNKASAAASKIGSTTLGKMFSKGVVKTKDVATYGGGLISLFFMASSIMNAVKATKEAPKGEKKATFMHVLSEQYLGMILFQPSINLVYKAAGNKYRGMTEGGRKALADLIAKTNVDETLTKEGLKVAQMQKKLLLKGVDESKVAELAGKGLKEAKQIAKSLKKDGAKLKFWEKPLKAMGNILGLGLDKMKTPKFLNIAGKKIKIPQPTLKGFVGGLGRLLLIMMVVQPLIQKPMTKLCHKIFGEPKAYLAKQNASNNDGKNPNEDSKEVEPIQQPSQTTSLPSFDPSTSSDTNLLKKWTKQAEPQQTVASTTIQSAESQPIKPQNSQEEIASLGIFDKNKQKRYIPSIEPYVPEDNSKELNAQVNEILKRTDKVIMNTKKHL